MDTELDEKKATLKKDLAGKKARVAGRFEHLREQAPTPPPLSRDASLQALLSSIREKTTDLQDS